MYLNSSHCILIVIIVFTILTILALSICMLNISLHLTRRWSLPTLTLLSTATCLCCLPWCSQFHFLWLHQGFSRSISYMLFAGIMYWLCTASGWLRIPLGSRLFHFFDRLHISQLLVQFQVTLLSSNVPQTWLQWY